MMYHIRVVRSYTKGEQNMNRNQIMEVITELSYSQGFYGRLKRDMTDEALDYLEAQNFKDSLDLILFLEG
jgi:hypothetical protein